MSDHENYYTSDDDDDSFVSEKSVEMYPLKDKWVLYDHTKDSDDYNLNIRELCEFDSVIGFWQVFNNYPMPSKIFNNGVYRPLMNCTDGGRHISSISVFKKGIRPTWEDPKNKYGAEFFKRKFSSSKELDENWLNTLISCVSCDMDSSVTGVRVVDSSSMKKNEYTGISEFKVLYRIELWFEDTEKKDIIEEQFKKILCLEDTKSLLYKTHIV